ncbi:hypothetical protein TR51_06435 [Kitasatospora griseola]|uniref:DNA-binding phage zinc finger domain-containing protein n=1 Tax=Kitasatospora griseola TaxID=2064 RepID=A0A0D0Q7B4_KITGR|nr:hypothetical protein [Kitasatospora griseola]KIQ67023.1 hypothetical protein TR51_06435 [Kitasatospora griseola]
MNDAEAVMLARYVRALCPQQKFDEYTADTYGDVFADYDLEECKQAAAAIGRRQPFIAPAEIIDEVRAVRARRLADFRYEPNPDETSAEYVRRLRGQISATIAGHRPPALPYQGSPRPIDTVTARTGRDVPTSDQHVPPTRIRSANDIECSYCGAKPRHMCKTSRGRRMNSYHPSRIEDAQKNAQQTAA